MPTGGEWHWTADGQIYWKGDTSSDEIVGHMFAFGIAYDLLPDADLETRIAAATRRIMDHIVSNGYHLVDVDGQPTTWGKWSPKYFARGSRGFGAQRARTAELPQDGGAHHGRRTIRGGIPGRSPTTWATPRSSCACTTCGVEMNYSDEELAMLPFYAVFRYERDAAMLAAYRRALDDWWQNMQRELSPLWTFIYLTGRPDAAVDLPGAVWTLYRMPLDLVDWDVKNSHRHGHRVGHRSRSARRGVRRVRCCRRTNAR